MVEVGVTCLVVGSPGDGVDSTSHSVAVHIFHKLGRGQYGAFYFHFHGAAYALLTREGRQ